MIYSAQQLTQSFSLIIKYKLMTPTTQLTQNQRRFILEQQIEYEVILLEGQPCIIAEDIEDDLPW